MAPVTAPHVRGTLLAVGVPTVRPVGVAGGCVVPPAVVAVTAVERADSPALLVAVTWKE
ncbi:hypothetical protein M768_06045 [Cellulosimicrobium cellulans F16]|uniref:Uncharacterized protein n=1 Tax=Cellulosimicrobium cellulans F16 TaxID=1350482 RepID=A0A0M0FDL2_CELCE|nr:hypothetical protein M768_06045 [Cellulosimicrobium cellulans F16]